MSSGSGITPAQPGGIKPSTPPAQAVQIVSLPEGLKNAARAMRVEGEVIALNKDGTVTVRTSEGNIDLSVKGRQPPQGARVEIDIPPANAQRQQAQMRTYPAPPQQSAPRPSPEQPPQQAAPPPAQQAPPAQAQPVQTRPAPVLSQPTPQPAPQTGGTAQPSVPAPATPPAQGQPQVQAPQTPAPQVPLPNGQLPPVTSTLPQTGQQDIGKAPLPLPTSYQPSAAAKTAGAMPAPNLAAGQSVRLAPYSPALAQSAIQQGIVPQSLTENIANTHIMRAAFQAGVIVSNAQSELQKTLVQTLRPGSATQTPQSSLLNNGIAQPSGKSPSILTPPVLQGNTQPQSILQTQSLLPTLTGMVGTSENAVTDNLAAPRLFQLDAKIIAIKSDVMMAPQLFGQEEGASTPATQTNAKGFDLFKPSAGQGSQTDARPSLLTAVVTGFTPQNMPLVSIRWPGGQMSQNFVLQYPAGNLSLGTQILLEPQGQPAMPAPGAPLPSTATGLSPLRPLWPMMSASPLWPALDDIYQTLMISSPQLAQMMARAIPSPSAPAQLGPAALLFIAAMRTGNLENWLGDKKIDTLLRLEKSSFLSRLSGDTASALQSGSDAQSSEWRSYPIPMLWQNEISKVMLHMRHEREAREENEEGGGARFVMDVSLTRMGEVQLDGLVRGKRLDLVVRTELPISHVMQDAMRKAYADALANTDVYGEIGFQSDVKGWMKIARRDDTVAVNI
ncbi:MAG: hypothetical protein DI626_01110 [Micavibrio aeruginosavorus]|uniref:Uncharacterized protein n=1 Tax=Micavibrio aeruginosavorus TaxID=349221 RepID=A0A2W5A2H4_9BACT|nr:MAG: hypothetical protein DI626_01110 [Micavibrio aeruginosavorus]